MFYHFHDALADLFSVKDLRFSFFFCMFRVFQHLHPAGFSLILCSVGGGFLSLFAALFLLLAVPVRL